MAAEAGVAKGVLHRHFANFDTFLASLVLARMETLEARATQLRASAGHGAVTRNLTEALVACLDATTLAVVRLVTSRDELRERLRPTTPTGIPLLAEMTKAIASYRTAERGLGRIELAADVDQRALILIATPICCSPARKTSRRAPRSAES